MPVYEHSPMFGRLVDAPAELIPLFAVLAVLHQRQSGKPLGTCVPTSYQISGALRHLGFEAEPVAACATVYRVTATFREVSDVGVWKRPPIVHPDGTTNGHMVVWASSFAQLVDATRCRTRSCWRRPMLTRLHANRDRELTDVTVSDRPADDTTADRKPINEGNGERSTRGPTTSVLKTTAHHPFWDVTTGAWIDAAELVVGESTLVGPDGQIQYVTAVRNFTGSEVMRDLTVDDIHTYCVATGETPVLVYNCGGEGPQDHVALGRDPRGSDLNVRAFADQVGALSRQ
ncbi:polymorphic toxin-type HINT domain-containing protein [Micromonosporaceae bacterium B7E4]